MVSFSLVSLKRSKFALIVCHFLFFVVGNAQRVDSYFDKDDGNSSEREIEMGVFRS